MTNEQAISIAVLELNNLIHECSEGPRKEELNEVCNQLLSLLNQDKIFDVSGFGGHSLFD